MSARLRRRIRADFGAGEVGDAAEDLLRDLLAKLGEDGPSGERVLAGVVLAASGDPDRLLQALELAMRDWRDILVAAGLDGDDWRVRLDVAFGA